MTQQRRTAQRAEIVPSGLNNDRDIVSRRFGILRNAGIISQRTGYPALAYDNCLTCADGGWLLVDGPILALSAD